MDGEDETLCKNECRIKQVSLGSSLAAVVMTGFITFLQFIDNNPQVFLSVSITQQGPHLPISLIGRLFGDSGRRAYDDDQHKTNA